MIAYAYAQSYRKDVSHLVILDAPIPGTGVFDRLRSNPRLWHFAFHNAIDVAEMLVAGRERQYLQTFFNLRNFDPSAIDLETYVSAYSAPGAMRAGFERSVRSSSSLAKNSVSPISGIGSATPTAPKSIRPGGRQLRRRPNGSASLRRNANCRRTSSDRS
jgi:pimeloyl-ACP methyl ester carboxylesterase